MTKSYYLVVRISNKITSKDIRKRLMTTQYLTSKYYANKFYDEERYARTRKDKENNTLELWYVTECTDKAVVQVLKSTKKHLTK